MGNTKTELNSTEKEHRWIWGVFFFEGIQNNSCSHQTSAFHLPASEKEKVFVFLSSLRFLLYMCIYFFFRNILMYRNFVFPYSMKQIQLLGRVRDDGEKGAGTAREC